MKKIIAPLALIASLSALASCTKEPVSETVTPETKNTRVEVEVQPAPQAPVETVPTSTATGSLPENTQSGTGPSAMPRIIPVENQSGSTPPPVEITAEPVRHATTLGYKSPAGDETMDVTVGVSGDTIVAVTVTPHAAQEVSKKLQTSFASEVNSKVIGKKIKDFDIDVVGGASLTTAAFEAYVRSL